MPPLVSSLAPDFTASAVLPDGRIHDELRLSSLRGQSVILLFYPLDFSFVCPTEIHAFNARIDDFEARDTIVLGISVDSPYTHLAWRRTPVDQGGIGAIRFPLVSDLRREIASSYGVLATEGAALRGLFLIDPEGIIRHAVINDMPLGRSVDEALRMVDALRFHRERGEVCPAGWQRGQAGMTPTPDGVVDYLSRFATGTPGA